VVMPFDPFLDDLSGNFRLWRPFWLMQFLLIKP